VQLRSGGYIVINPTEALVAIDVNSGRSTKERNIEETAVRTNIEAAEEIARQVRLRDLAGLIVIDFIDMEETRHQRQVEHKVKDAMRHDRARIQIGRISAFGLLEMSRQRLRPSLLEHSTEICPHCAGTGRIRSLESGALHALRAIEEEGVRRKAGEIVVSVPPNVALYLLNQKRHTLSEIERRYGFIVTVEADDELHAADCEIERVRGGNRGDRERPAVELARANYDEVAGERPIDEDGGAEDREPADEPIGERTEDRAGERERAEDDEGGRRRRRRRRRRGGRREDGEGDSADRPQAMGTEDPADDRGADQGPNGAADEHQHDRGDDSIEGPAAPAERANGARADGERSEGEGEGDRRRRRGRRGGRRRRRENGEGEIGDHAGSPVGNHADGDTALDAGDRPAEDYHREDRYAAEEPVASIAIPMEHMPVEHMPVERPPYDPAPPAGPPVGPPVNVEAAAVAPVAREEPAAPPPMPIPPVAASAPQPEPPPPAPAVPVIEAPPEKPKRGWWRR
jgi:ribonuclease E